MFYFDDKKLLLGINVICRDEGPKYGYWAMGRVRRHQVVLGQVNTDGGIQVNGP